MKSSDLKEYIIEQDVIVTILEDLGCRHIKQHDGYYTCSNPDGNNSQAVTVYINDYLTCVNYTRNIAQNKTSTDIFDLISYYKDCTFAEALRYVHELLGLDYYQEKEEVCESLQIIRFLKDMHNDVDDNDDSPLKPISENVLNYYLPYGSKMWEDSNVSLITQRFFELSFDPYTNSIAIPIRDEVGSLIAVKARRLEYNPELGESKFFFLEPGAKSQVLYGLYQNSKLIQTQGVVYVGESEKFVHQLYDIGYYGVSTGGSKVSKRQVEMLTRLGVKICFCFDKDIDEETLKNIANMFIDGVSIFAVIDKDNILDDKQSPSDDVDKWMYMIKNNVYKIK